jgi:hypothetical protein
MNFGMAVFFPGMAMTAAPDPINLTFWVMTKKPRFASDNRWTAQQASGTLDLGSPSYAAKGGSNMEYLNFKVSRADLAKLTSGSGKFSLGSAEFTFTPGQLSLIRNFLAVTDIH